MDPKILKGSPTGYRVVILGHTGSGKTTLSRKLAALLGPDTKLYHLDYFLWNDNWIETPRPVIAKQLAQVTEANDNWVVDGNGLKEKDGFWHRATDFIWLDYPLYFTFWRLFKRTIRRASTGEALFNTNCRETWTGTFFSRKSIFLFSIREHWNVRSKLEQGLESAIRSGEKSLRRFRASSETDKWFASVEEELKRK